MISSFKIIDVVPADPKMFFWIAGSVVVADVNPNGIKTPLTNGLSTFSITGKPVHSNDPQVYLEKLLIVLTYAIEFLIIP